MFVLDIEPNDGQEGAVGVVLRNNTVGSIGLDRNWESLFVAACGPGVGSVVRDVTITGNTVTGNVSGYNGRRLGLNILICGDQGRIREDFRVTDNTTSMSVPGPAMRFNAVHGVTVTGNSQPLTSGQLATFPGSTDVTYQP